MQGMKSAQRKIPPSGPAVAGIKVLQNLIYYKKTFVMLAISVYFSTYPQQQSL